MTAFRLTLKDWYTTICKKTEEAQGGTQTILTEFEKLKSRMEALEGRMAEVERK